MEIADSMISGMQVPVLDAGFFLGDSPIVGQQIGPCSGWGSNLLEAPLNI